MVNKFSYFKSKAIQSLWIQEKNPLDIEVLSFDYETKVNDIFMNE